MKLLQILVFILTIAGLFMIFQVTPQAVVSELAGIQKQNKRSLRDRISQAQGKRKPKGYARVIQETMCMLKASGKEDEIIVVCLTASALAVLGVLIGFMTGVLLLVPVLAIGLSLVPFWVVMLKTNRMKKAISEELETALSIITTSYLRSENLLLAIEENLSYLDLVKQLLQVMLFGRFQTGISMKRMMIILKSSISVLTSILRIKMLESLAFRI